MEIITSGRQTGKTESLLRWLIMGQPLPDLPDSWDRTILVSDHRRAEDLRERLHVMLGASSTRSEDSGAIYQRWRVLSSYVEVAQDVVFQRSSSRAWMRPNTKYAIDDLDDVLAVLFGGVPAVMTRRPDGER